ncbi:MAG: transposase, partial [Gammaproteobacteria bacterium]
LLRRLMRGRQKPLHLVVDHLKAHKTRAVRAYVDAQRGKLTLHFLPGYAPELNPDELVWSYAKRGGVARSPLRAGEHMIDRVEATLSHIARQPALIRSFFRHPSVAYISDC